MSNFEVPQISLTRYVDLLKRRRWQVVPVSLIGLLLGGFLSGVFGLRSVFVISGIGMTIVALACARGLNRLAVEVARASEPSAPVDTPSPRDDTPAVRDTPAAP